MACPSSPVGRNEGRELPSAVHESGRPAAATAVLQRERHLDDPQSAAERRDAHRELHREARRKWKQRGERRPGERALSADRRRQADGGVPAHGAARERQRDAETLAARSEGGHGQIRVSAKQGARQLGETLRARAEIGVAEKIDRARTTEPERERRASARSLALAAPACAGEDDRTGVRRERRGRVTRAVIGEHDLCAGKRAGERRQCRGEALGLVASGDQDDDGGAWRVALASYCPLQRQRGSGAAG